MRKAYHNITDIYQKRRFLQPELDILIRKRKRRLLGAGLIFAFILFLCIFAFSVSKLAISLYRSNLEKAGIITEMDMRIAILAHQEEANPADLVFLAKTIHTILNTAKGNERKFLEAALPEAIRIQMRYNIPASAVLGQAVYESAYGQSDLAKEAHNYFGLKAFGNWKGPTVHKKTKDYNKSVTHVQPFRKFPSLYDGFKGYVEFINQPRYRAAFKQKTGIGFVRELAAGGYCPDSFYVNDVARIMARHKLASLDNALIQFQRQNVVDKNK